MIIGFVGTIGSGKGTAGEILAQRGFFTESFAAPLKDITSKLFGWPRHLLEGDTQESREFRENKDIWWSERLGKDITPRYILQTIGTECMRECIHSDFWVACLEKRIKLNQDYVITDVRFPNEIDSIHKMGGKIVEIQRGAIPEWYIHATMYNNGDSGIKPDVHYSEWAWMGYKTDYTISNNGTKENLEEEIELMLECLTPTN
jgi:hypothetical protein